MDDYFMARRHVPAFGSWDSGEYLPFTECFESTRQGGLFHYTYHEEDENVGSGGGDLCVTGDLYQNDAVTPAMIVFPRNQAQLMRPAVDTKQTKMKKERKWEPGHSVYACQHNGQQQPIVSSRVRFAKPVDEDLYKISPEKLHKKPKKKKGLGTLASCCFVRLVLSE